MREDLDNHRGLFEGGDNLKVAATLRAVFEVDIEHALEKPRLSPMRAGTSGARWAASSPGLCGGPGMIAARSPAWGAVSRTGRDDATVNFFSLTG